MAADAFRTLAAWGIDISLEVVAITHPEWPPYGVDAITYAKRAIDFVTANGGTVKYLKCDSTWEKGADRGISEAATVAEFKTWMDAMRAYVPGVVIVDTHAINDYNSGSVLRWVDACMGRGAYFDAFAVDAIWQLGGTPAQVQLLANGLTTYGIPMQLIINPGVWNSVAADEQEYYTKAYAAAHACLPITPVSSLNVQSWYWRTASGSGDIPINLPETGPYTHTRILKDVATLFNVADIGGSPAPTP
jgi:hypothetical protein